MDEDHSFRRSQAIDQQQWAEAQAQYQLADATYQAIRTIFNRTETRYFAFKKSSSELSPEETERIMRQIEMGDAKADEHHYGRAFYVAVRTILGIPAPDLAAVIYKLELIRQHSWDEETAPLILADLKRLHARNADGRRKR